MRPLLKICRSNYYTETRGVSLREQYMSEFDEYIVHGEPGQKEKADAWQTAIGLRMWMG